MIAKQIVEIIGVVNTVVDIVKDISDGRKEDVTLLEMQQQQIKNLNDMVAQQGTLIQTLSTQVAILTTHVAELRK